MTIIVLSWVALIVAEAYRHYYLIVLLGREPNRILSAILRTSAALALWLLWPFVFRTVNIDRDQWWAIPIMQGTLFWFLFDLLLNLCRGKPFWYLGKGKWIDRIQVQTVGAYPAFWFKLILAVGGIILAYYGFNALRAYPS